MIGKEKMDSRRRINLADLPFGPRCVPEQTVAMSSEDGGVRSGKGWGAVREHAHHWRFAQTAQLR